MSSLEYTSYLQLQEAASKWTTCPEHLFAVFGKPGLGKSRIVCKGLQDAGVAYVVFKGKLSPLRFYIELFKARGMVIVVDDADSLLNNNDGLEIIRCLAETEGVRRVSWNTTTAKLKASRVPPSFETTSRLVLISNKGRRGDMFDSVISRGLCVSFNPPWSAVLAYVEQWCEDKVVLKYVRDHLNKFVGGPDIRDFLRASSIRNAGFEHSDWRSVFSQYLPEENDSISVFRQLLLDSSFKSHRQRALEFQERAGMGRSTFYRWLKDPGVNPTIATGEPSDTPEDPAGDLDQNDTDVVSGNLPALDQVSISLPEIASKYEPAIRTEIVGEIPCL